VADRVAVAVVSYRTPRLTASAARSALSSAVDVVLIVDNASGDDTIERLREIGDSRVSIVENDKNEGFGVAANIAARSVAADTLLFLNSDAELRPEATTELLAELERWGGRALVGPRLVSADGEVQPSAGLLPAPTDLAIRALGLHAIGRRLARLPLIGSFVSANRLAREYATATTATQTMDTSMVSGACFAIGREAFEELGGFDERFFMYFEDADLCRRVSGAGMPIRYVPSAVVSHIGGASSSEDYHFGPHHARSMRQYLGKWYGPGGSALALALLWLRAVGFSVTKPPRMRRAWRALGAAIRG